MNIKELIKNTFGVILALTIMVFVIVYSCFGTGEKLKETLTITIGFFGGFATLGAAYIAACLFNGWTITQKYSNALKASESINETFQIFIQEYDNYIDILWRSRTNPDEYIIETIKYFNNLVRQKNILIDSIFVCKLSFNEIDFEKIEIQIRKIDNALKNTHPAKIASEYNGYIDSIYVEENHNFTVLRYNLQNIYLKDIRQPMLEYLLKEALS